MPSIAMTVCQAEYREALEQLERGELSGHDLGRQGHPTGHAL
jgi:hypothetical protein